MADWLNCGDESAAVNGADKRGSDRLMCLPIDADTPSFDVGARRGELAIVHM